MNDTESQAILLDELAALRGRITDARGAGPAAHRRGRALVSVTAVVLAVGLGTAWAGGGVTPDGACPNGLPKCFVANNPALAADVNYDFDFLRAWLTQKVGTNASSDIATTGLSTTGSVTASGTVSGAAMAASGAVTGASVTATTGEVKLGTNFAPRAPESLRIVRGNVNSGSNVGSGFTASGGGSARQTVTFTTPFGGVPTVVCSVGAPSVSSDSCDIVSVSATGFTSSTGTRNVQWTDANITFIAIGPN